MSRFAPTCICLGRSRCCRQNRSVCGISSCRLPVKRTTKQPGKNCPPLRAPISCRRGQAQRRRFSPRRKAVSRCWSPRKPAAAQWLFGGRFNLALAARWIRNRPQGYWRQVILWLAHQDQLGKGAVWIKLPQRRFGPGTRVEFIAGARDPQGQTIEGATFDVEVIPPDGLRQKVATSVQAEHILGSFSGTQQAGDYTVVVTATRAGENWAALKARFLVYEQDLESSTMPLPIRRCWRVWRE